MSNHVNSWSEWLNKSRFEDTSESEAKEIDDDLLKIRNNLLNIANLQRGDVFLDVGTGTGLISLGAYERLKNTSGEGEPGTVIASDAFEDCLQECYNNAAAKGIEKELVFIKSDASNLNISDNCIDVLTTRSVLVHIVNKSSVINEFYRVLKTGGRYIAYEAIMSKNTKFYELINPEKFSLYAKLKEIEDKLLLEKNNPLVNFNEKSLRKNLEDAGFSYIEIESANQFSSMAINAEGIDEFWSLTLSVGLPSVKEKILNMISMEEYTKLLEKMKNYFGENEIILNLPKIYIYAKK